MRGRLAHEQAACCAGGRPTVLQIGGDSLTNFVWQRQKIAAVALAGNGDDASGPVHVIKCQTDDFASPQPQPCQEQQDGAVASPNRTETVTALEERADFVRRKGFWQAGKAPVRNPRDGAGDVLGNVSSLVKMAEEAAQSAGHNLRPPGADLLARTADEPIDIIESQRSEVDGVRRETFDEKGMNDREAVPDRDRAQAPVVTQKTLIPALDPRDRSAVAVPIGLNGRETWVARSQASNWCPVVGAPHDRLPGSPNHASICVSPERSSFCSPSQRLKSTNSRSFARRVRLVCEPGIKALQVRRERTACGR